MKTLQEQYNKIKEGKGSKHIFLTEAKKQFSNMLTNPMGFDEASTILKQRGVITENYVDLQPINTIEASPKAEWENKFANFISEVKKEAKEENIKVEAKKVDKSVEETQDHNFDYKDQKNLDNQIGQEVLNGIYFEAKQNPDKDLDEIRKIVSKNLEKDRQYYMKNAAFGIEGLGYQETEVEEVSGKYKASGYSDKLKKLVKESLVKEDHSGNPNDKYVVRPCKNKQEPWAVWEGEVRVKGFATKEQAQAFADKKNKDQGLEESYDEFQRGDKGSKDVTAKDKGEDLKVVSISRVTGGMNPIFKVKFNDGFEMRSNTRDSFIDSKYYKLMNRAINNYDYDTPVGATSHEDLYNINEGIERKKMKKESLDDKLNEIDKQSQIVALEAKLDAIDEMIETKNTRLNMIGEDENLSELVDKTKIKAMQKEVKLLEKQKAKMEKMYEKMCGKSYTKEEIVDEDINESFFRSKPSETFQGNNPKDFEKWATKVFEKNNINRKKYKYWIDNVLSIDGWDNSFKGLSQEDLINYHFKAWFPEEIVDETLEENE